MTELRQRMIECLKLRCLSERTQAAYVRAVRQLVKRYDKYPPCSARKNCASTFVPQEHQALLTQHFYHRHLRHRVHLRTDSRPIADIYERTPWFAGAWATRI